MNECLQRHRGRAFRGEKVYSAVPGYRFARESFIAAKCQSKIFAPFEQTECKILFLPSYSPVLNPIEVFWANFKQLARLSLNKLSNLAKTINYSFYQICT
ncbi:hypothetical protein PRO82_000147 [Candidatus Protochlamydia amoebophila]|nr:hypothetical protein [Candidatus Protochlamydia amoebophila]